MIRIRRFNPIPHVYCIVSAARAITIATANTLPADAGLAFVEDFQSSALNPALEDTSSAFAIHDNAIWRNSSPYSSVDRAYIRTTYGDYAQHDFTAAVSFTVTNYQFPSPTDGPGSIVYFGLGSGAGNPSYVNEVNPALVFRACSLDVSYGAAGRVDAVQVNGPMAPFPTGDGYDTYRVTASGLTHRAQITKAGDSLTFLFDENYNGTFAPDASYMISNLSTTAPWFFDPGNSHIFFGTSTPIQSFSQLAVVPEPSTVFSLTAGLVFGGWHVFKGRRRRAVCWSLFAMLLATCSVTNETAHAQVTLDMVTVGDPGNTADDTTYGAVADSFQIMKYEWTNLLYTDFLNSVAATDTYSLYNASMGSFFRGGITQSGSSGSYTYAAKTNMGDKPVNFVDWFAAARVSNWLMNGATGTSSTETGAYTLSGSTSGNAPAVNSGATFYVPTEDQWYKAAYYKGGSTSAGYWDYATQSDSAPTAVTAGSTGIGSSGSTGNFANFNQAADWNGRDGNVTTVGTNGGASAYGAFDMSGNVFEWNDLTGAAGSSRGLRGGGWYISAFNLSSADRYENDPSFEDISVGFRLASPVPVPEPSTCAMALAGLACGGYSLFRRRRVR